MIEIDRINAQDLYRMELIMDSEISPNGNKAIFVVERVKQELEKKYSNLWLSNFQESTNRIFTTGDQKDLSPTWSPNGDEIAFLSNRQEEKQFQIYLISALGGEARKLTQLDGEFGKISWSPNGKKIIFEFRKKDPESLNRENNELQKKLGITARRITRIYYRLDGYGWNPIERWHLWIIDVESGRTKQLTQHEIFDETGPFWSPDNLHIGYFSNCSIDPDLNPSEVDLWILNSENSLTKKLPTPVGFKNNGAFSSDGKLISYIAQQGAGNEWQNTNLWIIKTDGKSPAENLTGKFDILVDNRTLNDNGPTLSSSPIWSNDNHWIYFQVTRHGNTSYHKINIQTREMLPIVSEEGVVGKTSMDYNQEKLLYLFGENDNLPQLWLKSLGNQNIKPKQVTQLNDEWFKLLTLGQIEKVRFKNSEDYELQGWIVKPPNFEPTKNYPAILEIHGGPLLQYGNIFMHEFQYLAARGYVVFFCNPRGSQGYGEMHAKAIHDGNWGTKDYEDLMCWTDYVENLSYIDKNRVGVTGGSYGGYMTAWIIGHTKRFKCAVAQRCVSNLISMWGSSDFNWEFQETFGNQAPYENIEKLWQCSPIKHIGSATTPTLVIHSEQDLRCPLEQGQQLFTALKKLGVDTKFLVFPEEFHGLSRNGRTDRRIIRLEEMVAWFDKYLV
jgi:dipeptidyl aminopeptidase/acylaminoacyl peptidase